MIRVEFPAACPLADLVDRVVHVPRAGPADHVDHAVRAIAAHVDLADPAFRADRVTIVPALHVALADPVAPAVLSCVRLR